MKITNVLCVISGLWTVFCILVFLLDLFEVLPIYDIYIKKKTDIIPRASFFPGNSIRLSAEFSRSVSMPEIVDISWNLTDSTGKKCSNLPNGKDIDIKLLPDYSGIMKVNVDATLRDKKLLRTGEGTIHIVQTQPKKVTLTSVKLKLPSELRDANFRQKDVEVYFGEHEWFTVSDIDRAADGIHLTTDMPKISTWDGKAFLRFKDVIKPHENFQYQALMATRTIPND